MAESVSDFLIERLHPWGVNRIYGYPGDGINGLMGALEHAATSKSGIHPDAARGAGRLHGLRPREVQRYGRRVHGDLGPRRHAPPERPVRRRQGPPAGAWPSSASRRRVVDRRRLPAGGRPHRACSRTWRASTVATGERARRRSATWSIARCESPWRSAPSPASSFRNDVQDMDCVETRPEPRRRYTGPSAGSPPRVVPAGGRPPRAAEVLNAGERVAMLVGAGCARRGRRRSRDRRSTRRAASPRRCSARRCCPTTCPSSPARSGCSAPSRADDMMTDCDTLLMVGTQLPVLPSGCPKEGQARGVQIDIKRRMLEPALPDGGQPRRRRRARRCARSLPAARSARRTASWREKIEKRASKWWKVMEARAMHERRSDQPAAHVHRAVAAPARPGHRDLRLRLRGQLVRPRPEVAARA